MNEVKQLDFSGQRFYVGIDVHKKRWVVTIRSLQMELKTFSMNPSPEELSDYLHRHYPGGRYYSVYEAGFSGFWIHRRLHEYSIDNMVIHAADVPTKHKEKTGKTDKVDSRKLARELENRSLKGIYIPDEFYQQLRSLRRLRRCSVQNQTRVKNRIKGHLHYYGITIPSHWQRSYWSGHFINWLATLSFSYPSAKDYLSFCLEELQQHRERTANITRKLRQYCKDHDLMEPINYLRSVVGIGFVTAVTFFTELIDINRFATLDHLAAFVGLVPSVESSGDRRSEHGLTERRNRFLRHVIIEAAWVAARKDPALTLAFKELTRRMKRQDAIIRIARKLLNRIRYVWKNQQRYVVCVVQ
jgi:transposase